MMLQWDNRKEYLEQLSHKDCVRFALFCARQVEWGWENIKECVAAIEVTERWLEGTATAEECKVAANVAAAYNAATAYTAAAAAYAAYAAANVTAATYTANAAAAATAYTAAAAYTAYAADAAAAAANAAAHAANAAAAYTAYAAAKEAQMRYLYELLYVDDIFEEKVLKHEAFQ